MIADLTFYRRLLLGAIATHRAEQGGRNPRGARVPDQVFREGLLVLTAPLQPVGAARSLGMELHESHRFWTVDGVPLGVSDAGFVDVFTWSGDTVIILKPNGQRPGFR